MPSPDARYDSWYEVWTTWGGVLENAYNLQSYAEAVDKAEALKAEYFANCKVGDDLAIYLLHHYCGQSDSCECGQYATDHRAYWQAPILP